LNDLNKPAIYLALLHYPVYNKHQEVVTTAVTNIDVHDISRSGRTYGLEGVFFVTPIEAQQGLVSELLGHWTDGPGFRANPVRAEAFRASRIVSSLDEVIETVQRRHDGTPPDLVATSARAAEGVTGYEAYRARLREPDLRPQLLLFGTGWGLLEEVLERADTRLMPVQAERWGGPMEAPYNHLSVRSAVGIVLDRLLGDRATNVGTGSAS
jgi:hypothetical protein